MFRFDLEKTKQDFKNIARKRALEKLKIVKDIESYNLMDMDIATLNTIWKIMQEMEGCE